MARIEVSIDVVAAPEAIWALMCDPRRYPEFVDATDRMVDVPDKEFKVGYTYKEYGGVPPFKGESTWRVVELEPIRRQVHVGDDGMMTVDLVIDLTPIEGGTRLTHRLDLRPRWFLAPINAILWPLLMRKRAWASMEKTNQNVKHLIETSGFRGVAGG